MRKTIVLTLCSFFLLSCSGGLSSSNGGISFPGTSSAATSNGGIPWGNTSSAAQTTGGGGIPWGNTSSAQTTGGGGIPWGNTSSAPTSQGGQAVYPADNVRNFLNSYGVYDVTIPSFDAEAFNTKTTMQEGFPILLVEGWFSTQEKAANAGNGYLNTLNNAGVWTIYDYMEQGGYVVALHSNNKVAIQIGITPDSTRYALDTAIVINTGAAATSQQQSSAGYEFLKEYPAQELSNFMNSHGVGSVYIPRFTAEQYDYYSEVVDDFPDFTVVGLYATQDAGVKGTNHFLLALDNDANWTLYNYWESNGYFMAMHSSDKVAIMITYNFYKDINLYALEATVIINTGSASTSAQGSTAYSTFYSTAGFPSSIISSFLSNLGIGGIYFPTMTGASRYGYFMMSVPYTGSIVMDVLYVVCIFPSKDAANAAVNTYYNSLINAGLQCDYMNNGGEVMLNGSSGSLVYAVMSVDPSYLPVNVGASSGEYTVFIGLTRNPEM